MWQKCSPEMKAGFAPCTPEAVMEVLAHYGVTLKGRHVVRARKACLTCGRLSERLDMIGLQAASRVIAHAEHASLALNRDLFLWRCARSPCPRLRRGQESQPQFTPAYFS